MAQVILAEINRTTMLIEINDPTWGKVEIQRWSQLHFLQAADHPMEVILVRRKGKKLSSKAALANVVGLGGGEDPSRANKFGISTWDALPLTTGIVSLSQRLHWTLPRLGTTEQGQRSV